ncbi:MAG: hypothetical protein KC646_13225 [Candidatus Cloacimonetes bacterium]|nr:hypothetical protein [Candidatus Cloacimonadota bacterium]
MVKVFIIQAIFLLVSGAGFSQESLRSLGELSNKSQYFVYIEPPEERQAMVEHEKRVNDKKQKEVVNAALNDLILENQKLQKILKEKLNNKKKRMIRVQEEKKRQKAKEEKTKKGLILPSARKYIKEDFDSLLDWTDKDEPVVRDIPSSHASKTKKYKSPAEFLEQDPIMFEEFKEESLNKVDPIYKITSRTKRRKKREEKKLSILETLDYVALAEPSNNYENMRPRKSLDVPTRKQRVRIRRKHKNSGRSHKRANKPIQNQRRKLNRDEKLSLWNFQMGVRNPGSTNSSDMGNDGLYFQVSKKMDSGDRAFVEMKQWKVKNRGNGKFHSAGIGWKHYYEKHKTNRKVTPYVAAVVDHVNGTLDNYDGTSVKSTRSKVHATARLGAEIKLDQFLNMDVYLERGGQTLEFADAAGNLIPIKTKNTIYGLGLNYIW